MKTSFPQRFLLIYSGVVTSVFAVTVFCGILRPAFATHAAAATRKASFEQIDVQRINVVEPDGTLRLVISDKAKFPGSFFNGKEVARPDRKDTGLLFINDEGTEMGGLTFDGSKDKTGQVAQNGHLSFDQYDQDQLFSVDAGQEGSQKRTVLQISDRGDYSLFGSFDELMRIKALPPDQRQAAMQKFVAAHPGDHARIVLGRTTDKSAILRLKDPEGRDRLVLKVGADGSPVLQFLDEAGKVVEQLPRPSGAGR